MGMPIHTILTYPVECSVAYWASSQFRPVPIQPRSIRPTRSIRPRSIQRTFWSIWPIFFVTFAQVNSAHFLVSSAIWKASEKAGKACVKNCPPPIIGTSTKVLLTATLEKWHVCFQCSLHIAFMKAATHGKQGVWEQQLFSTKGTHEKEHTTQTPNWSHQT